MASIRGFSIIRSLSIGLLVAVCSTAPTMAFSDISDGTNYSASTGTKSFVDTGTFSGNDVFVVSYDRYASLDVGLSDKVAVIPRPSVPALTKASVSLRPSSVPSSLRPRFTNLWRSPRGAVHTGIAT